MLLRTAALTAVVALAGTSLAQVGPAAPAPQAQPRAPRLKIGDPAPALVVEKWLKGEPVPTFEKGRVYLVELWATWCGPCIMAMPHLSHLQRQYRDKGVTVIGVDALERHHPGTLEAVETFVREQGDRMDYTVAYDGAAGAVSEAYYKAAGLMGIPASFLIDGNGAIAYIGHPLEMDWPLREVVAGTWDLKSGPERMKEAAAAFQSAARLMASDPAAGLAAWNKAEDEHPHGAGLWRQQKWRALLQLKMYDEAYAAAAGVVHEAIAERNAMLLGSVAWAIVDQAGPAKRDLDLALLAAEKADELTGRTNPLMLETLALVHFTRGDAARALELLQMAFDLAPAERKPLYRARLEEYRKAAGKG